MSSHMRNKVLAGITYPFPNFKDGNFEVCDLLLC